MPDLNALKRRDFLRWAQCQPPGSRVVPRCYNSWLPVRALRNLRPTTRSLLA